MRNLIAALSCLMSVGAFGQQLMPDILVHLNNYTVNYSQIYLQPLEVWYKVKCPYDNPLLKELKFTQYLGDSLGIITSKLSHYKHNDWDHGHMAPSASLDCNCEDKKETFTYLNCALQNDSLNQKVWKYLEYKERDLAKDHNVFVYIKVEFKNSDTINGARIPSGFNKTLIINGDSTSYYFPNEKPCSKNLEHYKID